MSKIIVSACLAGEKCRYDGDDNLVEEIKKLVELGKAITVCPEVLGGLPTPRIPCEINSQKRVFNQAGQDVTSNFKRGAEATLRIAKNANAKLAILKQSSPSCGNGLIYDGSFSGKKISGNGFTTELLLQNEIEIFDENNFPSSTQLGLDKNTSIS